MTFMEKSHNLDKSDIDRQLVVEFFRELGDLEYGPDYRLQLVPAFSAGSLTCRYKYLYDPEYEWKSEGSVNLWRTPSGCGWYLELWHRIGKRTKSTAEFE